MPQAQTIVDLLWKRGLDQPSRVAYSFIHSRKGDDSLTYGQLSTSVRQLACWLSQNAGHHDRAVLVYPPGLDFIVTLLACMAAGIVPIPVYPLIGSKPARSLGRIRHVAVDADAHLMLTTVDSEVGLRPHLSETLAGNICVTTDDKTRPGAAEFELPPCDPDALAFLQYTSGSTALPRGVQVKHSNLMANSATIQTCFGTNFDTRGVSWLPPYHDMGLIGGIIQPLFAGFPITLMAPHSFVQSPIRWLQAISDTQATTSPSPNFGYDLCVRKVTAEAVSQLDLSHWRTAVCGAECVSRATVEEFVRKFAPAGFQSSAFCPSYGLAESTLLVSASVGAPPLVRSFDREALESGRAAVCNEDATNSRFLVGNGPAAPGTTIKIVDPTTLETCSDDQIGEVWTSSASVAVGYWNKPEINAANFNVRGEGGTGPYLRTGDLGFFHDNQLFIAGRIKDLIILGGKNHFPEDLEMAIRESHPAFEGMPGAAFSLELDGREMLVVVQELTLRALKSQLDPEDLFRQINRALFIDNVRADAIVLVRTGTIARTTSGKVQRHQCRNDFLHNRLDIVADWTSSRAALAKGAL